MSLKHFFIHGRHIPYLLVIEVVLIFLFAFFVDYGEQSDSKIAFNHTDTDGANNLQHYYPSKFNISGENLIDELCERSVLSSFFSCLDEAPVDF